MRDLTHKDLKDHKSIKKIAEDNGWLDRPVNGSPVNQVIIFDCAQFKKKDRQPIYLLGKVTRVVNASKKVYRVVFPDKTQTMSKTDHMIGFATIDAIVEYNEAFDCDIRSVKER